MKLENEHIFTIMFAEFENTIFETGQVRVQIIDIIPNDTNSVEPDP